MSTAGYLQDAKNQQKRLAETITSKGITATATEKYKNLVDKVAQIENLKGEERTLENFTNVLSEPKSIVQLEYPEPKNLFDINNPTYAALSKANTAFLPTIEDGVISFNTYYAQRGGSGFVIPVEPNTTITISFDSVGSDYWTEIMAVESILDNVAINIYKYPQFKNITKYTLTQQAGKHYILFILYGVNGYYTAKIKNLQIEKGATATPYEPYTKTLNAKLDSKNLINNAKWDGASPYTHNGVTFTVNADGTVTANGTATGGLAVYYNRTVLKSAANKTFTISGITGGSSTTYRIRVSRKEKAYEDLFDGYKTFTPDGDIEMIILSINEGVTVNNLVFKPQLELNTTATPYTPYISDFSTVNVTRCGKNLFDIDNPQTFYYGTGATSRNLKIENGIIYSAGVAGQTEGQGLYIRNPKKTITISFDISYESTETTRTVTIRGFNSLDSSGVATTSSIEVKTNITSPTTITITNTEFEYIGITWFSSTRYGLKITNLQIELGSTATPYEPYQGQIYTSTATGELTGIINLYPTTTLLTDNTGAVFEQITGGSYKEILPSTDKNGITKVYQPSVDSSIDGNITSDNIKQGISILGVTGDYICNYTYDETTKELVLIL